MTRKLVHADVAARIAWTRKRLGLKRYEFAERLGVTRATQGNWEMGQMPRADLLDKIAHAGGVSVEWLLHGSDSRSKRSTRGQSRQSKKALQKKLLHSEELSGAFVLPDLSRAELSNLPRRYLERYQSRATELIIRLERELDAYRRALKLEFRAQPPRGKQKRS